MSEQPSSSSQLGGGANVRRQLSIFGKKESKTTLPRQVGFSSPEPNMLRTPSAEENGGATGIRKRNSALGRSLHRPERGKSISRNKSILRRNNTEKSHSQNTNKIIKSEDDEGIAITWWVITSRCITFFLPNFLLSSCCGMKDANTRQAFREKVAICIINLTLIFIVGFLSFGTTVFICTTPEPTAKYTELSRFREGAFSVGGHIYSVINSDNQVFSHPTNFKAVEGASGLDLTYMFQQTNSDACTPLIQGTLTNAFDCRPIVPPNSSGSSGNITNGCHPDINVLNDLDKLGDVVLEWDDPTLQNYVVYNGMFLDVQTYSQNENLFGADVYKLVSSNLGKDITHLMVANGFRQQGDCLRDLIGVGFVETNSFGCVVSDIILWVSLVCILGIVLLRFAIAMFFSLFLGWKMGATRGELKKQVDSPPHHLPKGHFSKSSPRSGADGVKNQQPQTSTFLQPTSLIPDDPSLMHTLVMVPCYSESEHSLRITLDSIAKSIYPSSHKAIFVVADGVIRGDQNLKYTHEFCLDLMELDPRFPKDNTPAFSYVALADGNKRKNFAKVYVGWYKPAEEDREMIKDRVPMILVAKTGNDEEIAAGKKPGNRGKRDSQVVLMNFLAKVMFDERMTELEYDIFFKLWSITGVHPEKYENVLMIDADTTIYPTALSHMVSAMVKDPTIIGACGETKIANKFQSWVSAIQVYEYFVSHNMAKAFESTFGCVTCLPGCFSIYRIKARKDSEWIPILTNPDIVEDYSEYEVDTLHTKNLLLLGEDRFLSTLMLRTFPTRKMVYLPNASCKTIVPDEFKILLSQRRRWINSTIHNLLELLLVKELCGAFCFSMQFVIFMELVGTVVLPGAIVFTLYVVISSIISTAAVIPLVLLAIILLLPAILILFTARKPIYIMWLFIYLLALPVWNFVLPSYAFWKMDDFSWGATRKTEGDVKGESHGGRQGKFDHKGINMKRWREWMADKNAADMIQQGESPYTDSDTYSDVSTPSNHSSFQHYVNNIAVSRPQSTIAGNDPNSLLNQSFSGRKSMSFDANFNFYQNPEVIPPVPTYQLQQRPDGGLPDARQSSYRPQQSASSAPITGRGYVPSGLSNSSLGVPTASLEFNGRRSLNPDHPSRRSFAGGRSGSSPNLGSGASTSSINSGSSVDQDHHYRMSRLLR